MHAVPPIGETGGNYDVAFGELGERGAHLDGGGRRVDVVDDEEPARVGLEPIEGGLVAKWLIVFRRLFLRDTQAAADVGDGLAHLLWRGGGDEEQSVVVVLVLPGILECSAGLALSAEG